MNRLVVFVFIVVMVCASEAVARTWTARNGQTTTGVFVRLNGGMVVIARGGRAISIPFSNFCDADQEYIRKKAGIAEDGLGRSTRDPAEDDETGSSEDEDDMAGPPSRGGYHSSSPHWASDEEREKAIAEAEALEAEKEKLVSERTWTDVDGRQIRAKLVPDESRGDQITLLRDGKKVQVPRERLSAEDIAYVDETQKRIKELDKRAEEPEPEPAGEPVPASEPAGGVPSPPKGSPFPTWQPPGAIPSTPHGVPPGIPSAHDMGPSSPNMPGTAFPDPMGSHVPPTDIPMPHRPQFPHHEPPSMPHFQPRMHIPDVPQPPQFQQVESYYCTNCKKPLPDSIKAGDRCPHCKAYLEYEENADGSKSYSPRYYTRMVRLVFWGLVVVGGIIGGIIRRAS